MSDTANSGLEHRARRAAKRIGLLARRSRWRRGTIDNHDEFQIIAPASNWIVAGEKYDMTAEDVLAYVAEVEKAEAGT